jgi:hypothetical protein
MRLAPLLAHSTDAIRRSAPQSGRLRIRPRRCVFGLANVSAEAGQAQMSGR